MSSVRARQGPLLSSPATAAQHPGPGTGTGTLTADAHRDHTSGMTLHPDIRLYNDALDTEDRAVGELLATEIDRLLPEAERKIWHAHPVWFLDRNPIVGYSRLKGGIRLLFWSGQSFDEAGLVSEGSFRAAEARFRSVDEIDTDALARWLGKSREIQWDDEHIRTNRGLVPRVGVTDDREADQPFPPRQ